MAKNPCYIWDGTLSLQSISDPLVVKSALKANAKKWVFQQEAGGVSGYQHFQIKCSLKDKTRLPKFLEGCHWSPSHDDKFSYVTKEDTRIDGPWTDKDEPDYIPKRFRGEVVLRPWQQKLIQDVKFDPHPDRTIHCVIDTVGNNGKSFLRNYLKFRHNWIVIPSTMDKGKDLLQAAKGMVGPGRREVPGFIIDIPRATSKRHFYNLAQAIEAIKDGTLFDPRYSYEEHVIEPAPVITFSNWEPPLDSLSSDRWRITDLSCPEPPTMGCYLPQQLNQMILGPVLDDDEDIDDVENEGLSGASL